MQKVVLITGSTDGIGLLTAKEFHSTGHHVLLHGRSKEKLNQALQTLEQLPGDGKVEGYLADLSDLNEVKSFAQTIAEQHANIDVLINNAGIFKTNNPTTKDGLDVRFVVNTIAPYSLTQALLPQLSKTSRVINLSSAAQAPVNFQAMAGEVELDDMGAYAQSKLAITMWTASLAEKYPDGPVFIAVNPGSLLASKMVKEGFGVAGNDLSIGAQILIRASLSDEFANASGQYFDNDSGQFASPNPDGLNKEKSSQLVSEIEAIITKIS